MKKLTIHELGRTDLETYRVLPKMPIVFVLDNIRSGLNVGSAFRTADAFLVQELYLCGITARPPHREILKTALGSTESVAWSGFDSVAEALSDLRQKGYLIVGVEQTDSSVQLQDFQVTLERPCALVFGNEVRGLSDDALAYIDTAIEIPQSGTKHSLNVSVCIGILAWKCYAEYLTQNASA